MEIKPLATILKKIENLHFNEKFDLVVGIAEGAVAPAKLIAAQLDLPVSFIYINFRDKDRQPKGKSPQLLRHIDFDYKNRRILLVDDRSVTGSTFEFTKKTLYGAKLIKTLAVNGKADYNLFDEECFKFPWKL